jgi:hypothetical protein
LGSLGILGIENRKLKIENWKLKIEKILSKKDATVRLSHGRPRRHRPIVRPSENVRMTTLVSAHFMNVEISVDEIHPEAYTFQNFDKRRALPFQNIQYIKFNSNRPIWQAYNICISQVLPILYISSSDEAAIREIKCLIQTMCNNGFKQARLINTICRFLEKGPFPATLVQIEKIIEVLSMDLET